MTQRVSKEGILWWNFVYLVGELGHVVLKSALVVSLLTHLN